MDPYGPVHRTAIMARAQENQAFAVMVNRVGDGDNGLVFAGGSAAIDPFGRVMFEAGREECRQVVSLDLDLLKAARRDYDYLRDRRLLLAGEQVEYPDGRREWLIA
ncbi:(R)-stereoselective amidase [compost metagenome]